jgi:tetratricopeptide (TPR) repeat protein
MQAAVQLYNKGQYAEALQAFLSTELDQEDYPEFSYYLGLCYARLKKYEEALLYLEQVVTSDLGFAQVYQARMLVGFIYAETQRLRLASFEFRKLLEEGYESAKVHAALAHVLFLEKKIDESLNCLDKALKLEPTNATALNSMGYVLAESNTRLNMAFMYCSKAIKQDPENPAYLDSLGWVLHKMGRHKEAAGMLRKALVLAPGQPLIKEHLHKVLKAHEKSR